MDETRWTGEGLLKRAERLLKMRERPTQYDSYYESYCNLKRELSPAEFNKRMLQLRKTLWS
jgi:hypothetical protein